MGGVSNAKFGYRTPAADVARHFADRARGKIILITGAAAGLGFETARTLASVGAIVHVMARSQAAAEGAVAGIRKALGEQGASAQLTPLAMDLSSLASVKTGAAKWLSTNEKLDILINNAGVMACPFSTTADGLETQIGVNHVGHFALTAALMPALAAAGAAGPEPARVVNLSSIANWFASPPCGIDFDTLAADAATYHPWNRYGEAKLANILHANELTRRCKAQGVNVIGVSLHPGIINSTKLGRNLNLPRAFSFFRSLLRKKGAFMRFLKDGFKSIPAGSSTTLVAALDPALTGGEFLANCQIETAIVHEKGGDAALAAKLWLWSEDTLARLTRA